MTWWDEPEPLSPEQAFLSARVAGRHGSEAELERAIERGELEGENILLARAEFREGAIERGRGITCLCIECRNGTRPGENESGRTIFRIRREQELRAQGLDWQQIARTINEEIARGDAL